MNSYCAKTVGPAGDIWHANLLATPLDMHADVRSLQTYDNSALCLQKSVSFAVLCWETRKLVVLSPGLGDFIVRAFDGLRKN